MAWPTSSRQSRGYGAAWVRTRERVLKRDGHLCQACARKDHVAVGNEVHHIKPKVQRGSDDDANLETLCHQCHVEADAAAAGRTVMKPCRVLLDGTIVDG